MTEPTPGQTALDLVFPRRRAMGRADFIETPSNADAAALVAAWRRWPERRLALCGPEGSGKTHLAHVFMAESGAPLVDAASLATADAPALVARGAVAVEDVDRAGRGAEAALFHLMNLAAAEGAALLLTGRAAPARWGAALPDLASRLAALTPARLGPPDDALLAAVIAKGFEDRALKIEPGLPAYLAARIERTFAAAQATVERLDAASLAQGRAITRRLAAEVMPL
jgi:chromosomal replication initiation ATPase DnaA